MVLWEEAAQLRATPAAWTRAGAKSRSRPPELNRSRGPKQRLPESPLADRRGDRRSGDRRGASCAAMPGRSPITSTPDGRRRATVTSRVTIPAEPHARAARCEYFIEATTARRREQSPWSEPRSRPAVTEVDDIPTPTPPLRHEATASVWTDYADYNRMKGNDRVWQTEGFVGHALRRRRRARAPLRLRRVPRRRRIAEGARQGQSKSARLVGLTYGYLEVRVRHHLVHRR